MIQPLAVLMDMDGTTVNSESIAMYEAVHALASCVRSQCKKVLQGDFETSLIERFTGLQIQEMQAILSEEYKTVFPSEISSQINSRTISMLSQQVTPCDGVVNFLDFLSRHGQNKYIVTSSHLERVDPCLIKTQLSDRFDAKFSAKSLGLATKPDPAVYLYARERLGIRQNECVAIEDSLFGVEAAAAAGMPVIGYLGGDHIRPSSIPKLRNEMMNKGALRVVLHYREMPNVLGCMFPGAFPRMKVSEGYCI